MFNSITSVVAKVFGTKSERDRKKLIPYVEQVNKEYKELHGLTDDQLREKTRDVRAEITKELPTTYHIYTYEGKEIIKKTYWFEMSTEDESTPQPQIEEGIEKVTWLKEIEIPYILNNTWASIEYLLSQIIEF